MRVDRKGLKRGAKDAMKSATVNPILFTLIYLLITQLLGFLSNKVMHTQELNSALQSGEADVFYLLARYPMSFTDTLVALLLHFMGIMLATGLTIYAMHVWRREESSLGNLFDGFPILLRMIGLSIVQGVFIFLWSLLFVVPGIIAALRYSQAKYLLIDRPELGIMGSIRESKRMMAGRLGEFFVLILSFLGWSIISSLPLSLGIVPYILSLAVSLFVVPYLETCYVGWYEGAKLDIEPEQPRDDERPPWEYDR